MVHVAYVDNDTDVFETKKNSKPWEWIAEQQAYLIQSIEGDVVIPAGFIKCLKHYNSDSVKPMFLPAVGKKTYGCPKCSWIYHGNLLDGGKKHIRCPNCGIKFEWDDQK